MLACCNSRIRPASFMPRTAACQLEQLENRLLMDATYQTSWIGNDFSGASAKYVQMHVQDAFVNSSGTVYCITDYEELHQAIAAYRNGDRVAANVDYHGATNKAITADASYVYVATRAGGKYYVARLSASTLANANFTGGVNAGNAALVSATGEVRGLTVGGGKLYAVVPADSKVYVFDTANLAAAPTSFAFTNGRKVAIDSSGYLWIVQYSGSETTSSKILKYSSAGVYQGSSYDITDCINPSEIALDNQGRLMVADSDPSRNNIRIYGVSGTPALATTFGDTGGFYPTGASNKGVVTPTRFDGITGMGTDSSGNYYVVTDGRAIDGYTDGLGTRVVSVTPASAQNWQLEARTFVETSALDPADLTQAYNAHDHMVLDYNKPTGQQWTWTGYSYNRGLSQADMRPLKHTGIQQISYINGQKFLVTSNQYQDQVEIYRMVGEQAIPAVIFDSKSPATFPNNAPTGGWIWRDGVNQNGSGAVLDGTAQSSEYLTTTKASWNPWFMDANGGMWQGRNGTGQVIYWPCAGLDANGVPIYVAANATETGLISNFTSIRRTLYDAATDTMWLMGWTSAHPSQGGWWVNGGSEIARYNNWSSTRTQAFQITLPNGAGVSYPDVTGISWAKDYLFVATHLDPKVLVYSAATGAYVTTLAPTGVGSVGNTDTADAIKAYYKADTGEYIVLVEDDGSAKTLMYRAAFGAPAPVIGVTAAAGNGTASLTWSDVNNDSYYNVYRSTTPGGQGTTPYRTGLASSLFVDTNVTNGVTYYYRLSTVGSNGEGGLSAEMTATPAAAGPTLSLTPADGSIYSGSVGTLTVTATPVASSGRSISKVLFYINGSLLGTVTGSPYKYDFRNITGPTNRAVTVVAYDNTGAATAATIHLIINSTALAAPTGLTATGGARQASLSWTASAGATSYTVHRATVPDGYSTTVASGVSGGVFTDTTLLDGVTYYYTVTAVSASATSATSLLKPATTAFPAPSSLSATAVSSSQINLAWTDNSNSETSFIIDRATDAAFSQGLTSTAVAAGVNVLQVSGLAPLTVYYFRVRATNSYGVSAFSSTATATTASGGPSLATVGVYDESTTDQDGVTAGVQNNAVDISATSDGAANQLGLGTFKTNVAAAFSSGNGGVINFDNGGSLDANGPAVVATYGSGKTLRIGLTFGVAMQASPMAPISGMFGATNCLSAPDSGTDLGDLTFSIGNISGGAVGEVVTQVAFTLLTQTTLNGLVTTVTATFSGGTTSVVTRTVGRSTTTPIYDAFYGFVAPAGESITSVSLVSNTSRGNTTHVDDLAFVTAVLAASPMAQTLTINEGAVQRSSVGSLTYEFSSPVILAPGAFSLVRRSDGLVVQTTFAGGSAASSTYVLRFAGSVLEGSSLPDGVYDLVVHASAVRNAANEPLGGSDRKYTFHRLFGDHDGNRSVDNWDYFQFSRGYRTSTGNAAFNGAFDANSDGVIDSLDYGQFTARYGVSLKY